MASDLKKRVAARLRAVLGSAPVVDLGAQGGPSKSYIYRLLKEANPSIEELDAFLRAYNSNLGEFFEPWKEESKIKRHQQAAAARQFLEELISGDADLTGIVDYLQLAVAFVAPRKTSKQK